MTRREWLRLACAVPAAAAPRISGWILVHEHILVDFAGADLAGPHRYDRQEVFRLALPKLNEIAALGCRRLQECTPNFLGRDPGLLARLAAASGLEIWTNTGLYGARHHIFLPGYARTETAAQLARRWIAEARDGVGGLRPRFIKIGVNQAPLHPLDRKLVQAAALTSRETGLTIASHTGGGAAALEQLEMLDAAGVEARSFVWVHAQNERDHALHARAAKAGAWVEFDGIQAASADWHLTCVRKLAEAGGRARTLISQDSGWYHVGEPGGGDFRGYAYLFREFVPRLEPDEVQALLIDNPIACFGR